MALRLDFLGRGNPRARQLQFRKAARGQAKLALAASVTAAVSGHVLLPLYPGKSRAAAKCALGAGDHFAELPAYG